MPDQPSPLRSSLLDVAGASKIGGTAIILRLNRCIQNYDRLCWSLIEKQGGDA